jgi:hypothetical protein
VSSGCSRHLARHYFAILQIHRFGEICFYTFDALQEQGQAFPALGILL